MKSIITLFFLSTFTSLVAQKNCNVYKWAGDSCRYNACIYLENAPSHFQLTKAFHDIYDKAISICPDYSDAYRAKSVAYLKTGDFIQWKRLMDKAVDLQPKEHLGYRGWSHFQFFRDYKAAIKDLERLELLNDHDIGYSQNGMYHLQVAKALCYKMIGEKDKAIAILERHTASYPTRDLYDYFHLGVLYLETKQIDKSLELFRKQEKEYDFAENRFYLAKAYMQLGNMEQAEELLQTALRLYQNKDYLFDNYTHQIDKVYLKDIEDLIHFLNKNKM